MALLLFAATDLSFPAGCADAPAASRAGYAFCGAGDAATPEHQGDDCFCCSRTVRITEVFAVPASLIELPAPVAVLFEPRSPAVRRVFHPPIA